MRVRGVIFDLDGTLADTLPVAYAALGEIFREYSGVVYSDSEIHAMFGPCERGLLRSRLPEWEPAFQRYLHVYEAAHAACPAPFKGIPELLDALRVPIAVVTGKGAESAAISLRLLGLADRFPIVEAGDPHGPVKPERLRRVLQQWNISPSEVAHVGDAPSDVRAGRECGVITVAAAWSPETNRAKLEAENPDHLFESVAGLRDWLGLVGSS